MNQSSQTFGQRWHIWSEKKKLSILQTRNNQLNLFPQDILHFRVTSSLPCWWTFYPRHIFILQLSWELQPMAILFELSSIAWDRLK
jgi:hypothetical protein